MNENYKEVDFKKYCPLCEHEKKRIGRILAVNVWSMA